TLFLGLLRILSLGDHCNGCYFGSFLELKLHEAVILTGLFMLIATSVGVYNRDCLQDFRTFLKRFFLAWQIIFLAAVAFIAFTKAAVGLPFGWYIGILSIAMAVFMAIQFTIRAVLAWRRDTRVLKKRVIV